MIFLSSTEEKVLECILNEFQPNRENHVHLKYDVFPQHLLMNINKYLDALEDNDLIVNYYQTLADVDIYLTQEGIAYFINKKKHNFPKNSIDLLKQMMKVENTVDYLQALFKGLGEKDDERLRAMMRKLREEGYIISYWADNVPYHIVFNERAYELEENNFQQKVERVNNQYNFNGSTFNEKVLIHSNDSSINIHTNELELFDKMLEEARKINGEQKNLIISTIEEMKMNVKKPTFLDKYNSFIAAAANHMTIFGPFLPMLSMFLGQVL